MSAIDLQNALQIRDPMQISCGIAARPNINLTFADLSGFVVADTNPSASLDAEEWPVIEITDLQGDGCRATGSRSTGPAHFMLPAKDLRPASWEPGRI